MLNHYLMTGFRNLWKNKVINLTNVFGLGLALACCILEYCFVRHYNNMDAFHAGADRIYMVTTLANRDGAERRWGDSPEPMGPFLAQESSAVERFARYQIMTGTLSVGYPDGGRNLFSESLAFVDPEFLSMFSFPMLAGKSTALQSPNSIVLSREAALKLFGTTDCLNETLTGTFLHADNSPGVLSFVVAGVADYFPKNASFRFNILASWSQLTHLGYRSDDWKQTVRATFIQLKQVGAIDEVQTLLPRLVRLRNVAQPEFPVKDLQLEPLPTLSQNSYAISGDIGGGVAPVAKLLMMILASLIMLLAIFNFINVSLANGAKRLTEIAYRKTAGAVRSQVVFQFLTENFILASLGLISGVALAHFFLLPGFAAIGPAELKMDFTGDPWLAIFLMLILLVTVFGGGGFPAFYVSRLNAVEVFKGTTRLGAQKHLSRMVLGFQFFLAFITVAAGVVFVQNDVFQRNLDWGYRPDGVVVVPVQRPEYFAVMRDRLLADTRFTSVAGSMHQVGRTFGRASVEVEGEKKVVTEFRVGIGYLDLLGMNLLRGRFFDPAIASDSTTAIIVNELFVKSLGLKDPVNQTVRIDSTLYAIIGVVADFHHQDFMKEVQPAVIRVSTESNFYFLSARTTEGDRAALAALATHWKAVFPDDTFLGEPQDTIFDYYFAIIDAHATVILFSTFVALLLAATGLFGITSLRLSGKVKELSIRKVLGAEGGQLAWELGREVSLLLLIAILLAGPLTFYYLDAFMRAGYRYSVSIGPDTWIFSIVFMVTIVSVTIGSLLIRAVTVDPAKLMRSE